MAADSTNSTTFDNTDVYYSYLQRQIIAGVIGLVCILGIAGNTLVILAVALSRKLHHTTNYFVLNLSLADLLTCLFLPMAVVALLNDVWPLPDFLCIATGAVFVTCLTCSVNCLACVAFNRYILITKPKTMYRRLYTPRRTILAIILVWFVPLSVVIIAASTRYIKLGFDPQFSCCAWVISESDPGFYFVMFSSCCPLQFAVLSWSYGNIFYHVRKHAKAVAHMEGTSGESDTTRSNESRGNPPIQAAPRKQSSKLQIEVTKNLFCVVCVFLICTAPFGISLILGKNGLRLYPIGAALLCCNSCVNPIIYAAKHPQFRQVFKSIILCRFSDIPERVRFC